MRKVTTETRFLRWLDKHHPAYFADVSQRNVTPVIKKDLFGFADVAVLSAGGMDLVQLTTLPNHNARAKKMLGEDLLPVVSAAASAIGVRVLLVSFLPYKQVSQAAYDDYTDLPARVEIAVRNVHGVVFEVTGGDPWA